MTDLWHWLLAPMDAARAHEVDGLISWHARLMTAAWAVLAPLGVLAARFFKIPPGARWPNRLDDRRWWIAHRACQYAVAGFSALALTLMAVRLRRLDFEVVHARFGWTVLALLVVQVLGGLLRGDKGGPTAPAPDGGLGGDHYDMTPRRVAFERVHKSVGYLALLAGAVAVVSGLWTVNAPRWMGFVIAVFWTLCVAAFVALQRRGLAIDTYQAIWGPDPTLPGAQRPPIGWGVRRLRADEDPWARRRAAPPSPNTLWEEKS